LEEVDSKEEGSSTIITVNPKLYPLEAVYSAAYVFMDRAYIVLDGDPEKEIIIKMTPKSGEFKGDIKGEFNNELLNYADYLARAKETRKIRELILQRLIITNDPAMENIDDFNHDFLEGPDSEDEDYLDDPEGIAIPWEEKYGKDSNDNQAEQ
jgi:His-Xaa-Ser system protein HxsD